MSGDSRLRAIPCLIGATGLACALVVLALLSMGIRNQTQATELAQSLSDGPLRALNEALGETFLDPRPGSAIAHFAYSSDPVFARAISAEAYRDAVDRFTGHAEITSFLVYSGTTHTLASSWHGIIAPEDLEKGSGHAVLHELDKLSLSLDTETTGRWLSPEELARIGIDPNSTAFAHSVPMYKRLPNRARSLVVLAISRQRLSFILAPDGVKDDWRAGAVALFPYESDFQWMPSMANDTRTSTTVSRAKRSDWIRFSRSGISLHDSSNTRTRGLVVHTTRTLSWGLPVLAAVLCCGVLCLFLLRREHFGSAASGSACKADSATQQGAGSGDIEKPWDHQVHLVSRIRDIASSISPANLSLDYIAATVHLSPGHVSKVFRKVTGETIQAFLVQFRLDQAKELLIEKPEMTVADVARSVGYLKTEYFSRVFRERFGRSPSRFRDERTTSIATATPVPEAETTEHRDVGL